MRQAELCDWALDPALFTSLCDSLNRFFTQRGMITSGNNSPLALGAPHSLQVPPYTINTPPTLASLTHPSPLPYPPVVPPTSGVPRRPLHIQGQGLQRPQLTQPGKTWTSHSLLTYGLFSKPSLLVAVSPQSHSASMSLSQLGCRLRPHDSVHH